MKDERFFFSINGKEVTGLRKDGTTFPMEMSINEMIIGEEIKFTGIIKDITERKQAFETVRQAHLIALHAEAANKVQKYFSGPVNDRKSTVATPEKIQYVAKSFRLYFL